MKQNATTVQEMQKVSEQQILTPSTYRSGRRSEQNKIHHKVALQAEQTQFQFNETNEGASGDDGTEREESKQGPTLVKHEMTTTIDQKAERAGHNGTIKKANPVTETKVQPNRSTDGSSLAKRKQGQSAAGAQINSSSALAKRNLQFQVDIQEGEGSDTNSDYTQKTKQVGAPRPNESHEPKKGERAILPQQIQKIQSQIQINRPATDFAYSDLDDSNTGRSQLAVGRGGVDHGDPFGMKGLMRASRSPSGQQQYDSDGMHVRSQRDAVTNGSVAAATEVTRQQFLGYDIKDMSDREIRKQDLQANAYRTAWKGGERLEPKSQAGDVVLNKKMMSSQAELRMGGRGSLQEHRVEEPSLVCATELTLGHLDSSSRQDTQGRDGPAGTGGRASRGSIRTVQLNADGINSTSGIELRQAAGAVGSRELPGKTKPANHSQLIQAQRDQKNDGSTLVDAKQSPGRSRNEHQAGTDGNQRHHDNGIGARNQFVGRRTQQIGQGQQFGTEFYGLDEASLRQLSQAALESSLGKVNETDLVSDAEASQNDYMADRSSRQSRRDERSSQVASERTLGYQRASPRNSEGKSQFILMVDGADESAGSDQRAIQDSSRTFLHELICKQGAANNGEVDDSTLEVATAAGIASPPKDRHLTSLTVDQQDAGAIVGARSQAKSEAKKRSDPNGDAVSSNKSKQTAQSRRNSAKINKKEHELHVEIQQSQEHETLVAFEETPIKIKDKSNKNGMATGSGRVSHEAVSEARRCLSRVLNKVGQHIATKMAEGVKLKPALRGASLEAQEASVLADASSTELLPRSQAAGAPQYSSLLKDHEEDAGRQQFEESRVEMRNWRGVGIEQINEKGSLEEQSKDQSHRPQSQLHLAPLAGSQGQASIQNSVHDIQEGSKDESRYVTQDGRNSTRLSQFGDLGDPKEVELTVALYPDLANGSAYQDRSPISHQNKTAHPAQLNNLYNSSRKEVGQVSSLSRPALQTTVSPILSIEANIGRALALKRAVQQITIGPDAKNPIAADVRMFEDGAWQLPESHRYPVQRSVVIENTAGLPLGALNAADNRNQSHEGGGTLPAKASGRNQSQKHLPLQTSDLQQKQPSAAVSPKLPHSPRKLVQQLDEYYHKRNQLNASEPNDSDIFKDSKTSKISKIQSAHQYSTIPQHALGASSIRPFADTPISPILPLQEVAEEAQEVSKKSLQKLGKLKRPAVPKGLKMPPKSRYARKQPEPGFEPEKPMFGNPGVDPEFMRKYGAPRNIHEQEGGVQENEKEALQVGEDFNLREFLYQNKLEGLLGQDGSPPRGSGIHSFHRQQQQRGSLRNRLPAGTTPQMLKGFDYMSRIRDKNIAKALSHTHLLLTQSTETGRRGNAQNSKQALGQLAAADLPNGGKTTGSRHPASINHALEAGLIDIDKAYLLIQFIQKAHGEPTLTDAKIHAILRGASQGRLPRDKSNSRVQEFKWLEVMKFMQSNPHVLVQLLTLTEPDVHKPARAEQFFNRRPRYTDKILQRMHQGLPGIIGSLHHGSGANLPHGMPTSTHQGIAQQGILPPQMLPGRNLQTLSNAHQQYEQPSFEQVASLPRSLDREPAKAAKQSSIEQHEQRHRNQTRVGKSSFSPVLTKITKGVANLDESRSTKAPVLMPVRERASYAASQIEPKSTIMPVPRGKTQQAHWQKSRPSQRLPDETYLAESQEYSSQEPGRPLGLGHPQFHSEGPPQMGSVQRPDRRHQGDSAHTRELKSHQQQLKQDQIHQNKSKNHQNHAHLNDEQISIQIDRVRPMFEDQFPNTQSHIDMVQPHQDALTASGDDGVTPHHPATKGKVAADMKIMVQHMDLRKPKTNEHRRRQQTQSYANPDSVFDPHLQAQLQATSPGPVQGYKPNFYNVKSANYSQSPTEQRNWPGRGPDRRSQLDMQRQPHAGSHMVDQRTELTSRGSVVLSRFEELATQKRVLEAEEAELSRQRLAIVEERDKVTRQLKRLERKEELIQREDQVKKQRLILEIEKKRLREDIAELDSLKMMLEGKKKDTQTGFGELAESNKELRSLKSGDLHRERSMMLSKQSTRSRRIAESRVAPGSNSHTITDERDRVDDLESRDHNGKEGMKQSAITAKESQARNQRPYQPEAGNFDPSRTNATPDGIGAYDSQPERSHSRAIQRAPANPDDEPTKPVAAVEHHTPVKGNRDTYEPGEDEQRLISSQRQSRKSVLEAYRPPEPLEEDVKKTIQKTLSNSRISKEQARMLSSPKSNSNLTFLSGAGVFDWAQSRLMEDVLNKRDKFEGNDDIYSESEVLELIEEVKQNQKTLRGPDKMRSVYQKAFETLQELMLQMNQHILFQMIAKKYNEVNLDNTVKLLVRCKQLLASRQLVFKTLEGIMEFEKQSKQIRRDVDSFLEAEPTDPLISSITEQAHSALPEHTQAVIDDIAALRDHHKLFSKMGATTSKGNQVLNVMAYKRRDAMRYLLREYEAVRRLVQVVDITMPLIVKK